MDKTKSDILWTVLGICFLIVSLFQGTFVDESEALRALETQGYSNVKVTDHKWLLVSVRGCGSTDAARFDALVVNPAGKKVNLYVCVGWPFKGSTIRTD